MSPARLPIPPRRQIKRITGVAGFEPTHEGVKVPCLTENPRMPEPQSGALTTSPHSPS
ncbi:hypothetical protein [Enterococcus lactis]|uniref:hypothetical protein n=1 Tax=Enterococcus lactis TaxID=357441 RepID=UPI0022E7F402|nr:hypothetical protein [Enterococcus lactis]